MASAPSGAGKDTRTASSRPALRGFGEKGFAATSVREIAALAGTNIASISYHFGGKEGLRDACAEHIVELMQRGDWPAARSDGRRPPTRGGAGAARRRSSSSMALFLLLEPEARLVAGFMLREMAQPSTRARHHLRGALRWRAHPRLRALGRRHRPRARERGGQPRGLRRRRPDLLLPHRPPDGPAPHRLARDRPRRGARRSPTPSRRNLIARLRRRPEGRAHDGAFSAPCR